MKTGLKSIFYISNNCFLQLLVRAAIGLLSLQDIVLIWSPSRGILRKSREVVYGNSGKSPLTGGDYFFSVTVNVHYNVVTCNVTLIFVL